MKQKGNNVSKLTKQLHNWLDDSNHALNFFGNVSKYINKMNTKEKNLPLKDACLLYTMHYAKSILIFQNQVNFLETI